MSTSSWQTISNDGAGYKSMRALCAVVVLDLMVRPVKGIFLGKKLMLLKHSLTLFTQLLLQRRILSVLNNESSVVMAALDTSVTDAKIQVAAMQSAISSCWNDSLPKALAALSFSPSEIDGYVLQVRMVLLEWLVIYTVEFIVHTILHVCASSNGWRQSNYSK